MSLPKSKMISASKALLALAAKAKYNNDDSCRAIQNQTVTVNVQQHPNITTNTTNTASPASIITNTKPNDRKPDEVSTFNESNIENHTEEIPIIERDVNLDLEPSASNSVEAITKDYYEELDNLHSIVNNYETVAKALLLIRLRPYSYSSFPLYSPSNKLPHIITYSTFSAKNFLYSSSLDNAISHLI